MPPENTGMITEWPQSLVWATFDSANGAADALSALQAADSRWLVNINNAAVIQKNSDGTVTFNETGDRTGMSGLGTGALVGGIVGMLFPPAFLASTAAGAAAGGLGAQVRDAGFEDNALRAVANELAPGQSALIAVVTHQWVDDVVRFLERTAHRVGWTVVTKEIADVLQTAGR